MDFKKPTHILITGASSGIGQALALHYAALDGVQLSVSGRDQARLDRLVEACRQKGAEIEGRIIDVTDRQAMAAWLADCDARQPVDLVIANAGISGGTAGDIEAEEQARQIFDVNLNGVLNTIHPLIDPMIKRREGQIAIMSSLAGFRGFPGAPAYCASKAAVKSYGESLRGSLAPYGVGVSVICPGFVTSHITDVNDFTMPFKMPADRAAQIIARGLLNNRGRIAFPWPMLLAVRLIAALPDSLCHYILKYTPAKK